MSEKLFVVAGPSGSGKTTLVDLVVASWKEEHPLKRAITYTTRPPRPQEQNGRDYFFITEQDFKAKKEAGFFLETTLFCNHWYGSPSNLIDEVQKGGSSYILIMDQEGAKFLKGNPCVVLIWIMPPNEQELIDRLQKRDGLFEERREKARQELQEEKRENIFDYHLVNNDLQTTVFRLKTLILSLIFEK